MERKRVGTISMAVVLIGLGVLIFISQVNKVSAVGLGMKFWPIILFLLGGEILWAAHKNKDGNVEIKYDILSIFMVLVIVGSNLAIYGIIETGIMDKINTMVSSESFEYQIAMEEIELGDNIKKIVVDSSSSGDVTLRTGGNKNIVTSGSVNIVTDSEEKAKEIAKERYIQVRESGDTAYINILGNNIHYNRYENINPHGYNITIPGNRKVEIRNIDNLELILDKITKDWVIDSVGNTKILLEGEVDLNIQAFVNQDEGLKGNVNWNIKSKEEENSNLHGELIYGQGNNTLNILNSYEVIVNRIK